MRWIIAKVENEKGESHIQAIPKESVSAVEKGKSGIFVILHKQDLDTDAISFYECDLLTETCLEVEDFDRVMEGRGL